MSATDEGASTRGRVRTEQGAKRVRTYLRGELVADTVRPLLVWEIPYYPTYYIPRADVHAQLIAHGRGERSPSRGEPELYTVVAGAAEAPGAALVYADSPIEELRDLVRLEWSAMDAWFEEDEEVFTHARSPYTRIDILPSSRRVRVELDGVTLAESTSARLLFETGLPTRYYLPKPHVRVELLELASTVTHCPYKGSAQSFDVRLDGHLHENLAWCYPTPLPESERIAGMIAFYNEKVDLRVDGALAARPSSRFA